MTDRRPPSLGTYRPAPDDAPERARAASPRTERPADQRQGDPDFASIPDPYTGAHQAALPPPPPPPPGESLPRILTTRVAGQPGNDAATQSRTQKRRPPPPPARESQHTRLSWLRLMTYSVLGLIVFVAAAGAAAFMFVPTDVISARIAAEVKARTGRDLKIAGRPSLTLWPRPAVSLRDVSLSAPAAMGGGPLISAAEIEVAVQILPLLLHDVTIDRLILRKPVFDLQIDAQGRKSWDFADAGSNSALVRLAQAAPTGKGVPKELQDFVKGASDASVAAQLPGAAPSNRSRISDVTLGNVSIVDGTVRYRDVRGGVEETATALNATFTLANIASPLESKADLIWRGEPVVMTAQLAPFRALMDGRPIQAQVKATAAPLTLSYEGSVATQPDLDLDGRVSITAPSADKLMRWTGRPMAGGFAGALSLEGKLKQSGLVVAFNDARLSVGPLSSSGTVSVDTRGVRPFVKGALHVAVLDFNALKMIAEAAPSAKAAPSAAPAASPPVVAAQKSIEDLLKEAPTAVKPQVRGYTRREGWSDEVIDLSALGLFDADVKLGFEKVVWQELTTGSGQMGLSLKAKSAKLTLEDVQLYGGRARGIITVDGTTAEPTIGGNIVADGVNALPMLKGLADFDWISGKARISTAIAARGATERQLISTLNGKTDISVTDGAVIGYNFGSLMKGIGTGRLPSFERVQTEKTEFSEFAASSQITNGIARNADLRVKNPQLTATGAGTIDLPARTMDYVLKPKLQAGLEVPLKITGSLDKPTVTPDIGGLLNNPGGAVQAIQDAAKTPAGKEVQETVKGLLNGDPAAKEKAKGFLDQLFKK
jgi:AsmA protein